MSEKTDAPRPKRMRRLNTSGAHADDGAAANGNAAPAGDPRARRLDGKSFYRGDTLNLWPRREDFDTETFLENGLLKGWVPAAPFLNKDAKITAFGSCFAVNITRHLSEIGYHLSSNDDPGIYVSRIGEGLVNTYALLGQFEWALENKKQAVDLWHGFKAEGYGYDEDIRLRTRDTFLGTDLFIITLGLSEIWYDEPTGGVFWRAVPVSAYDASRHKFRVSTVAENKANLAEMYRLVSKHVPGAKVLFTLSPIPLAATFRPVSCLTANSASKAILRSALDEFLRENAGDVNTRLFYFPSYEIVHHLFTDPWNEGMRHPRDEVIESIMRTFEAVYCANETSLARANAILQAARGKGDPAAAGEAPTSSVTLARDERRARRARREARRAARGETGEEP